MEEHVVRPSEAFLVSRDAKAALNIRHYTMGVSKSTSVDPRPQV